MVGSDAKSTDLEPVKGKRTARQQQSAVKEIKSGARTVRPIKPRARLGRAPVLKSIREKAASLPDGPI